MNKIITNPQNLFNPIIQLNKSGARGNLSQYTQMLGMRGLMVRSYNYSLASKNSGAVVKDIIEQPVLNSFVEGLNISDFFNSAYGARKSMVDLALKTSKSGYMTRKLVDSAQDVIITTDDCGTEEGVFLTPIKNAEGQIIVKLSELIAGRYASADVVHNSETFVKNGELITQEIAKKIEAAGVKGVEIFSPIKCKCKHGICKKCYGIDLATNEPVKLHTAVGVIAAQSLGEPVTQLNMNSKHSGGVASGGQISQGYERIKQLFDIVEPKEHELAVLTEYDGKVTSITLTGSFNQVNVSYDNGINKVFNIPSNLKLNYEVDSTFKAGSALSHGSLSLKQALAINGVPFVVDYLIEEVQRVYRSQGIEINTKYLEIITKKIIENMFVTSTGDSEDVYLGQHIKIADLYEKNKILFDRKKQPITAAFQLTGLDKIPAFSYSFLSAASFQYTKKILINSAINGEIDELKSLNENVILGKLIPAGTGKMEDKISLKEIADDICKNKEY
jgi:DNA-directed RNA polymerase subunit beta'